MAQPTARPDDHAWEQEFAPKVTRGKLLLVATIYAVWLLFLAGLSAERWFYSFQ